MFTIDDTITDLRVKEREIEKLSFSMNTPFIATPELSTEAARCYILIFREGGRYRAHIGLYLPATDRTFIYTYSDNPFGEDALGSVVEEATGFTENMGFMLDELDLATMSGEQRDRWFDSQDIFGHRPKPEPAPAVPAPAAVEPAAPVQPAAPAAVQSAAPVAVPVPSPPAAAAQPPEPIVIPVIPVPPPPQSEPRMDGEAASETAEVPPEPRPKLKPRGRSVAARATAQTSKRTSAGPDEPEGPAMTTPAAARQARTAAKPQIDQRSGTVNREHEALVRLLASF